ncbi:MAG: pantoate--beta-alanine ligase [Gemmatimonadota bacterium]
MREITESRDLREWVRRERAAGRRIGFVPTMGALHEGHLTLVDEARRRADAIVMSVFVNPLQFGTGEDFERYPRDPARDRALAEGRGVDLLFFPSVDAMYPPGAETRVVPGAVAERWEGSFRPGHFVGVLTVVAKLFHLVEPDIACFGQKDIQQATLVQRMVRDLDWPIDIVIAPTVREADGLALSSRNAYLSAEERTAAMSISAGLGRALSGWRSGERSAETLAELVREQMEVFPTVTPEYIAVVDPEQLSPVVTAYPRTIIAVAARVGGTRLLDNVILAPEPD